MRACSNCPTIFKIAYNELVKISYKPYSLESLANLDLVSLTRDDSAGGPAVLFEVFESTSLTPSFFYCDPVFLLTLMLSPLLKEIIIFHSVTVD